MRKLKPMLGVVIVEPVDPYNRIPLYLPLKYDTDFHTLRVAFLEGRIMFESIVKLVTSPSSPSQESPASSD